MHLCFLVLPKACTQVFIKKLVVCFFLAFIDSILFSITQLPVGKTNMGLTP